VGTNHGPDDSAAYLTPPPPGGVDPWTAAGGTQQILEVAEIQPPRKVAEALGLKPGERVVLRRRLMFMKDKPVEIADTFYPIPIAAGTTLAEKRKIRGGAPALLVELGFVTAYGDEAIELEATPTDEEADLLQIATDRPVTRVFRPAYTSAGVPFEVAVSVMIPAGRVLRRRVIAG
jgi:GntR family transcriptional regulator